MDVLGVPISGLLDSGAARTVVNAAGWWLLQKAGLRLAPTRFSHVKVANAKLAEIQGIVTVPFKVGTKVRVVEVLVVASLTKMLILGIDFWRRFHLLPDFVSKLCEVHDKDFDLKEDPLTGSQREKLKSLIEEFRPTLSPGHLGCIKNVEHVIDTGSARPFKVYYDNMNPQVLKSVHAELDRRLKEGICEPSTSPWQSPLILVPKKNNTWRWVVDFRRLNKLIDSPSTSYPLPRIRPLLSQLKGATLLTTLDISDAYLQIRLSPESKPKTAFSIPGRGLFQFTRMPAGLKDAASRWQSTIDAILDDITREDPHVTKYMDDILIWSEGSDWEHHLALIRRVFERLVEAGVTINMDKSEFGRKCVKYLGHIIDSQGTRPNPEKVAAVINFPRPKTVRQIASFRGLAGWMRKYIPHYSAIEKPLRDRENANEPFIWGPAEEEAFVKLKEALCSHPVLRSPDFTKPFRVYTDASSLGTGAVLCQTFEDGEHVIEYWSKSLQGRERNYSATELECLAVVRALHAFRPYLEGYKFEVVTDHHSLLWLHKLKNPSGRLARWAMETQQFDFDVVYRQGALMKAPDALSRNPVDVGLVDVPSETTDNWYTSLVQKVAQDPQAYDKFSVKNGFLLKQISVGPTEPLKWVQVVPRDIREETLRACHDVPTSGHGGFFRTFERLRRTAYWPGMKKDVQNYVSKCQVCQRTKKDRRRPPGLMGSKRIVSGPNEVVTADLIGPLPRSKQGFTFLSVITDVFSKYVYLRALRTATAKNVVKHFKEAVIFTHGAPQLLMCDNGPQYDCKQMRQLCKEHNIKIKYNIPYNPRSNPTERYNQTIETMICSYIEEDHREWDLYLPEIQCAINTSISHVTGHSPHQVVFGSDLILDAREKQLDTEVDNPEIQDPEDLPEEEILRRQELIQELKEKLELAKRRNAERYNLRRRDSPEFSTGCMVWRKNFVKSNKAKGISKKLAHTWIGPYRVKERVGRVSYMLLDDYGRDDGPWHVEQLKKCVR